MVAELVPVIEELGMRYWPLPPALDSAWMDRELQAAGWEKKDRSYVLAGGEKGMTLHLRVFPPAPPAGRVRSAAEIIALLALAASKLPLRKTILLDTAEGPPPSHGDRLILAAGCGLEEIAAEEGLLLFFSRGSGERLLRFPCPSLLMEAGDALKAAGFASGIGVACDVMGLEGLGFLPPGGPGGGDRECFTRAIRACSGLLYGLAGYGALAFSFED